MIVTDSSCDLREIADAADVGYQQVPFVMNISDKDYVDDDTLDVPGMVDAMEASEKSHSACPSPSAWQEAFEKADHVIAMTISGRLSGSYNSAMTAREMVLEEHPDKQIEVIDSLSTGPKLVLMVNRAAEMIKGSESFDAVCAACREIASSFRTIFTLSNFHNLVTNGRVPKVAGVIAGALGIRVIGVGSKEGEIRMKEPVRGENRALKRIVKDMEDHGYDGSPMAISHCLNPDLASSLISQIQSVWQSAKVQLLPTRGLDSYYAERGGLIICYRATDETKLEKILSKAKPQQA